MTAPRSWSPEEGTELAQLHGKGLSLREIAKRMSRSADTISRHAASSGLSFDRATTDAATRASVVDAKARRSALGAALLSDLESARLRLGVAASAREFQSAAQGLDALMRSYVNLLRQEPDDGGITEARGLVGMILGAVMSSVEGVPRLNPTTEAVPSGQ